MTKLKKAYRTQYHRTFTPLVFLPRVFVCWGGRRHDQGRFLAHDNPNFPHRVTFALLQRNHACTLR